MIIISHNGSKFDNLIKSIAQDSNISVAMATKIINNYLTATRDSINSGAITTIPFIGTFQKRENKSRRFYNLSTGEHQVSPSHYGVKFTPKKSLIKLINERNDIIQ